MKKIKVSYNVGNNGPVKVAIHTKRLCDMSTKDIIKTGFGMFRQAFCRVERNMDKKQYKVIKDMMEDFFSEGITDPDAIEEQAIVILVADFGMRYRKAKRLATIIIDEIWDEAMFAAQADLQEAACWEEARREAMMGVWV